MYIVWDVIEGKPVGLPASFPPENSTDNWVPLVLPEPRTSTIQTMEFNLVNGTVVGIWVGSPDPLDNPATPMQIRDRHRELEIMPIEVFGILMDADERSEKRIQDAVEAFDDLPLEPGVVEEINGTKVILWKAADNSTHALDKATLKRVTKELVKQRAIRGTTLFKQLQLFKNTGASIRQLQEWV
jgi:hypothetical protein